MDELTDKHLDSPDGVGMLMESLWLRHQLNMPQRKNNVFIIDLPPLTEKEKAQIKAQEEAEAKENATSNMSENE